MKAGASILVSFGVGALVTLALMGWGSEGVAAQAVTPPRRHIAEPELEQRQRETTVRPAPLPTTALINVPRLDLKARIGTSLNKGPAWWPVTGRPGGGDTIAIAGHRTTHTRPFYWLERLRPGNSIYIRWAGRMHAYRVTGRRILSAKQLHIGDARGYEVLLLSACNPRGSARQRIVVYARPRA
jgi:LPXTG-site transpeptidase (sortase) family protein